MCICTLGDNISYNNPIFINPSMHYLSLMFWEDILQIVLSIFELKCFISSFQVCIFFFKKTNICMYAFIYTLGDNISCNNPFFINQSWHYLSSCVEKVSCQMEWEMNRYDKMKVEWRKEQWRKKWKQEVKS